MAEPRAQSPGSLPNEKSLRRLGRSVLPPLPPDGPGLREQSRSRFFDIFPHECAQ